MPNSTRLVCVALLLFALVGPAAALANHGGAAQPGQAPPAAPAQGAPQPPAEGTEQASRDDDDTSTLLVLGVLAGLLVLGGGLAVFRERLHPRRGASG